MSGLFTRYTDVPAVGFDVELNLFRSGFRVGDQVGEELCVVSHGGV